MFNSIRKLSEDLMYRHDSISSPGNRERSILVLDVSGSMNYTDYRPSRLKASKGAGV